MKPDAPQMLKAIAVALERDVLPHVGDKWAASSTRSAIQLLQHLAIRVTLEPRILADEALRLEEWLPVLAVALEAAGEAALAQEAKVAGVPSGAPAHDLQAAQAYDERRLALLERLLADRERLESQHETREWPARIVDYLRGRLERERELYLPVFLTPPF